MATTIRGLLGAVDTELATAAMHGESVEAARDAAGVIATAARVMAHLAVDGLDPDRDGPREQAIAGLVAASERVGDHGGPAGRATELLGAAGDAIAAQRRDMTTADRWALAVSVAALTRTAARIYAEGGPDVTPPTIGSVRRQASAVTRLGVLDPPDARDLAVQDYPIPATALTAGLSALELSAESAQRLTALVHRAATGDAPPLAGYEMKATARAMQAVTEYAAAIDSSLTGPSPAQADTSQSWLGVREALAVFHDGQLPDRDGPEPLLRAAATVHDGLAATFGPPDHITAVAAKLDPGHGALVRTIVDQVPLIAQDLALHTDRLAGRLIARADHVPVTEDRVDAVLRRVPVVARSGDFAPLLESLHSAVSQSQDLSAAIHANPLLGSGTQEPFLHAAFLAGRYRPDPRTAVHDALPARELGAVERGVPVHPVAAGPER